MSLLTPWMIGGGQALHSADIGRVLAYAAFGGQEGVVGPLDLRVRAKAAPTGSVWVGPGTGAILNRAAGGAGELYVDRNDADVSVSISATGGSGRSDLIVLQVRDPYEAGTGWAVPPDPAAGPYSAFDVISGVPSTAKSVADTGLVTSAIALARIDIPANITAITQGMIKDLRAVASAPPPVEVITPPTPQPEVIVVSTDWSGIADLSTADNALPHTTTTWQDWPAAATWSVPVPSWATKADVQLEYTARIDTDDVTCDCSIKLGPNESAILGSALDVNWTGSNKLRTTVLLGAANMPVETAMRGQMVTLKARAQRKDTSTHQGTLIVGRGSVARARIHFKRSATDS